MRVKARWNKKGKVRSQEEIAGALAFTAWRIAGQGVLNLENEGFQTDSQAQRLDAIAEFAAFVVQVADRLVYEKLDGAERRRFISALALSLADTMQDNRTDAQGPGDYRQAFVDLLNERSAFYAESSFSVDEGPSFVMRRNFGDKVTAVMGAKDRRWVADFVMDVEAPKAVATLRRALPGLFS